MAADLRKQISHALEVYEQTRGMYKDFTSQRQQLQDLISQISEQLKTSEDSLSEFSTSLDPENFVKIKVSELTEYDLNLAVGFYKVRINVILQSENKCSLITCNLVHNPQAKYCDEILDGNISNQVHFTWGTLKPIKN